MDIDELRSRVEDLLGPAPHRGSPDYGWRASVVTFVYMRVRDGALEEAAGALAALGRESGDARWSALAREVVAGEQRAA